MVCKVYKIQFHSVQKIFSISQKSLVKRLLTYLKSDYYPRALFFNPLFMEKELDQSSVLPEIADARMRDLRYENLLFVMKGIR